jgi:hypothetical protein
MGKVLGVFGGVCGWFLLPRRTGYQQAASRNFKTDGWLATPVTELAALES